jgi:hypothetical protein
VKLNMLEVGVGSLSRVATKKRPLTRCILDDYHYHT